MLTALANPTRFLALSGRLLPWFAGAAAVLLSVGFGLVFLSVPDDYQQGATIRIMYVHVPAAWLSLLLYGMMTASAFGTLVWRHPLADVAQKAAAPIGAAFTFLCLVTGAVWGKPMWGAWWVWDARLTSELVLLLIYLGIMALWRAFEEPADAARAAAIMTLVGFVNIPVVKFSVDWWNTLHQPASVFRVDGPTIAASMLWPLLVTATGFVLLALALHLAGMRTEILRRRVRALTLLEAQQHGRPAGARAAAGVEP